jgi:hypothetical protein
MMLRSTPSGLRGGFSPSGSPIEQVLYRSRGRIRCCRLDDSGISNTATATLSPSPKTFRHG